MDRPIGVIRFLFALALRVVMVVFDGFEMPRALVFFAYNWLQVSGTAERSQVDQRVGQQLHAIMPLLDAFKSE